MPLNVEPCHLGTIGLMNLPSESCHTAGGFMIAK